MTAAVWVVIGGWGAIVIVRTVRNVVERKSSD